MVCGQRGVSIYIQDTTALVEALRPEWEKRVKNVRRNTGGEDFGLRVSLSHHTTEKRLMRQHIASLQNFVYSKQNQQELDPMHSAPIHFEFIHGSSIL